ncbi:MAG: hypothetical protein AAB289_00560 [Chloroflexota bacterium]
MVKEFWWKWVDLVERLARGARSCVAPEQYLVLHQNLVKFLQDEAAGAEGEQRAYLLELLLWVKPWLNLDSLHRTDREILFYLFRHGEKLGRRLGARPRRFRLPKWVVLAAVAFLVVALVFFSGFGHKHARDLMFESRNLLDLAAAIPYYWFVGPVLAIAAGYLLWPVGRR